MTPDQVIAELDRRLVEDGELVTIFRYTGTTNPRPKVEITDVPAFVRSVKPEQLVGSIDQTAQNIAISPTKMGGLLPLKKGDKVIVQGRERQVELPKPIYMGGILVRINLVVTG